MKVILSRVDNGYIVELSKRDFVTQAVDTVVTVWPDLDAALAAIKAAA